MGIVLDAEATGNLDDDRPTPGAAGRLIREMSVKKDSLVTVVSAGEYLLSAHAVEEDLPF